MTAWQIYAITICNSQVLCVAERPGIAPYRLEDVLCWDNADPDKIDGFDCIIVSVQALSKQTAIDKALSHNAWLIEGEIIS